MGNNTTGTNVSKLLKITAETQVIQELLQKLSKEERIEVSIISTDKSKQLIWEDKPVFLFEVDHKCGNEQYNAVSVIRDLLKNYDSDVKWTRKKVEPLVLFKNTAKAV